MCASGVGTDMHEELSLVNSLLTVRDTHSTDVYQELCQDHSSLTVRDTLTSKRFLELLDDTRHKL